MLQLPAVALCGCNHAHLFERQSTDFASEWPVSVTVHLLSLDGRFLPDHKALVLTFLLLCSSLIIFLLTVCLCLVVILNVPL